MAERQTKRKWIRDKGKRLERTDVQHKKSLLSSTCYYLVRTDPAIVDYDKARDQFITQKYVTPRYSSYENKHHQT